MDPALERSARKLDMLHDISLSISIELGRRMMMIREILELERGSIVEFDKLASEPVDILINGTKMAEGEVVVIDKHFGIRITTMLDPADRIKGLKK
jgi:flagellar motor switch protein FliN/FliY